MNEKSYKEHLLKRVEEYLGDHYIDFTTKKIESGIIHLYQIGSNRNYPSMIYNPFEATVRIPSLDLDFDPVGKEKAVELFKLYFKE